MDCGRCLSSGDLVLIGKYKIKPAYPHPHGPPWELALNAGTAFLFKLSGNVTTNASL
jgi:hypothetical protein